MDKKSVDYSNILDMDHLDVIYKREYKNWGETISNDASYINSKRDVLSERKDSIFYLESQCDEKDHNKNFKTQSG